MRPWRQAGVVAVVLGLSACEVGPSYKSPTVPVEQTGQWVSLSSSTATSEEPPKQWWKLYQDSQLDTFIEEALTANTDLKVAEDNLSAARAILEGTMAGRLPQTQLVTGATRGRDAVTDEILEIGGHPPRTIWKFDALFDVSYEIDLFGRVRRSIEAAQADHEAVGATRDAVKITVAAETTRAYVQICALGEQIAVARHSLQVVGREAEITLRRHEVGANSQFDVVRAEGLVAQARAAIPPLEGQQRAAWFQLAALLGRAPTNAPTDVLACARALLLKELIPAGDGSALLKRRPDVRQAERRLAAATARVGVATADLYPKITLTGLFGGIGSEVNELATDRGVTWGVGPGVSWVLPDQVALRARVRQAQASTAAALETFDGTVLQALKEVEQALSIYRAELDRREALTEAQERARRAFSMAHDQFVAGALSNLELLATEQSLVAIDAAASASDATIAQDQIAIFKALGGGWQR